MIPEIKKQLTKIIFEKLRDDIYEQPRSQDCSLALSIYSNLTSQTISFLRLLTFRYAISLHKIKLKVPLYLWDLSRNTFILNSTSIRLQNFYIYGLSGILKNSKVDREKKIGKELGIKWWELWHSVSLVGVKLVLCIGWSERMKAIWYIRYVVWGWTFLIASLMSLLRAGATFECETKFWSHFRTKGNLENILN